MTDNMYIVIQFVGGGKVATYFGPRRANAQKYADAVGGTVVEIPGEERDRTFVVESSMPHTCMGEFINEHSV